jgi:hypothetical protein
MADYYNINGSHLTYVKYELAESKGPVVVEPMANDLANNYSMATGVATYSVSGNVQALQSPTMSTQVYDMDPSGQIMNYPVGHPKYQPSFQDTRIQDAQALQQQENTMFLLGTVTGLSLIVLSFMIYKQQTSE